MCLIYNLSKRGIGENLDQCFTELLSKALYCHFAFYCTDSNRRSCHQLVIVTSPASLSTAALLSAMLCWLHMSVCVGVEEHAQCIQSNQKLSGMFSVP